MYVSPLILNTETVCMYVFVCSLKSWIFDKGSILAGAARYGTR